MKKLIALLLVAIMAISLFAACSKNPVETTPKDTAPEETTPATVSTTAPTEVVNLPAGPVEIELWTDFAINEDILKAAIADFEAAYADKGYKITLNKFAGSQRAALMSAAIESNTLPALFLSAWFTTTDFVHQGLVADITDIASTTKDSMYEATYNSTVINDVSYMIPLYQSPFGMIYNADMFRAAGLDKYISEDPYKFATWTVSDLENVIFPALKNSLAGTEKTPFVLFCADNQADTATLNYLTMLGGKMWDGGYSVAGSDTKTVAALEKLISWTNAGYTNANVISKSGTEVGAEFKNQVYAVCNAQYTNYNSYVAAMKNGEIAEFDMRLATVPVQDGSNNTYTMANYIYGACVMNNGKEDQMAVAKEFLRWLLNNETNLEAIQTNGVPCYPSITEKYSSTYPIYAGYAEILDNVWDFTGNAPGYVATRSLLFPELQAAWAGTKTAAQALADYTKAANEVVEEYVENSLVLN